MATIAAQMLTEHAIRVAQTLSPAMKEAMLKVDRNRLGRHSAKMGTAVALMKRDLMGPLRQTILEQEGDSYVEMPQDYDGDAPAKLGHLLTELGEAVLRVLVHGPEETLKRAIAADERVSALGQRIRAGAAAVETTPAGPTFEAAVAALQQVGAELDGQSIDLPAELSTPVAAEQSAAAHPADCGCIKCDEFFEDEPEVAWEPVRLSQIEERPVTPEAVAVPQTFTLPGSAKRPCSALAPNHMHCVHGHAEDCPKPGDCVYYDRYGRLLDTPEKWAARYVAPEDDQEQAEKPVAEKPVIDVDAELPVEYSEQLHAVLIAVSHRAYRIVWGDVIDWADRPGMLASNTDMLHLEIADKAGLIEEHITIVPNVKYFQLTEVGMRVLLTFDAKYGRAGTLPYPAEVPPREVLVAAPTKAVVTDYSLYYISGPGQLLAHQVLCDHSYRLTDSCPVCP